MFSLCFCHIFDAVHKIPRKKKWKCYISHWFCVGIWYVESKTTCFWYFEIEIRWINPQLKWEPIWTRNETLTTQNCFATLEKYSYELALCFNHHFFWVFLCIIFLFYFMVISSKIFRYDFIHIVKRVSYCLSLVKLDKRMLKPSLHVAGMETNKSFSVNQAMHAFYLILYTELIIRF